MLFAANPTGGVPLQLCDPFTATFVCGLNSSVCSQKGSTFVMVGGSGFVLRAHQVSALYGAQSGPVVVESDTVLSAGNSSASSSPVSSASPASTVTAAATSTAGNAASSSVASTGRFTAGDMAGVGVGVGLPLALALIGAGVLIANMKKKLREAANRSAGAVSAEQNEKVYKPAAHSLGFPQDNYTPMSASEAPTSNQVAEMDAGMRRGELGTRSSK